MTRRHPQSPSLNVARPKAIATRHRATRGFRRSRSNRACAMRHQPQDHEIARPRRITVAARLRRRGNRIARPMSAIGGGFNRSTQHLLILLDEEVSMVTSRTWFTPQQRSELWERWKGGQCVADIARALERRNKSGVYRVLALNGGIAPMPRRRSRRALRLEEREEISRGIAAGRTIRRVAQVLGRSPSTVSREIKRNGGCSAYRFLLVCKNILPAAC